jgi:hypothetical protein
MTDGKIITLRFKPENALDMELYRELECEKNCLGLSMPACVKNILQEHFKKNPGGDMENGMVWVRKEELDEYMQRIQGMVREELVSLSSVLLATLVRMNGTAGEDDAANPGMILKKPAGQPEDNLPEYSDELPDGFDDVLGKMM